MNLCKATKKVTHCCETSAGEVLDKSFQPEFSTIIY